MATKKQSAAEEEEKEKCRTAYRNRQAIADFADKPG